MGRFVRRLILLCVALALGAAAGVAGAWLGSPSFRELVLVAGLASGVEEVQRASADALRDYPSEQAALALIAFVILVHQAPFDVRGLRAVSGDPARAPDEEVAQVADLFADWGCLPEGTGVASFRRLGAGERRDAQNCAEEVIRTAEAGRDARNALAERGLLSLCILTGHDFGTHFEGHAHSYSWGSLSDERWARSLAALNGWALETFGPEYLAGAAAGLGDALDSLVADAALVGFQP